MTLHISISAAAEAALRERAAKSGQSVELIAARIVEHAVESNGSGATEVGVLSKPEAERRLESIRQWAELARAYGHSVDDTRDSIYAGRGE